MAVIYCMTFDKRDQGGFKMRLKQTQCDWMSKRTSQEGVSQVTDQPVRERMGSRATRLISGTVTRGEFP